MKRAFGVHRIQDRACMHLTIIIRETYRHQSGLIEVPETLQSLAL